MPGVWLAIRNKLLLGVTSIAILIVAGTSCLRHRPALPPAVPYLNSQLMLALDRIQARLFPRQEPAPQDSTNMRRVFILVLNASRVPPTTISLSDPKISIAQIDELNQEHFYPDSGPGTALRLIGQAKAVPPPTLEISGPKGHYTAALLNPDERSGVAYYQGKWTSKSRPLKVSQQDVQLWAIGRSTRIDAVEGAFERHLAGERFLMSQGSIRGWLALVISSPAGRADAASKLEKLGGKLRRDGIIEFR